MKIINIGRLKIADLEAIGKMPKGLQWSNPHSSYKSINLIKNEAETRTLIVCTDIYGNCVSYATFIGNIDLSGSEKVLTLSEITFIKNRYPALLKEIESLEV